MLKLCSLIFLISVIVLRTQSLDSEKCKILPPERHCIIESAAKDRWPHTERYAFDWYPQKCILIRWSEHCGPAPTGVNNFDSERACQDECSGWA
ncbi:unnamed protein product [Parnassius mnemosyne]|uniref:BPTI/Kunitz inhibitor domain-containing protein n=1 Tax=Parnassius mnemosyne TaxID=213953 RepID=A0AAV1M1R0_9NEOP